jgi:hypothetical protein
MGRSEIIAARSPISLTVQKNGRPGQIITFDSDELPVNVLKPSDQRVFDGLLDLSLDETSGEWSESFVQEIML